MINITKVALVSVTSTIFKYTLQVKLINGQKKFVWISLSELKTQLNNL
jgi:hypothetical protein